MFRRATVVLLVCLIAGMSFSCKKQARLTGIEVDVSFSAENLTDNLITDMTVKWITGADFAPLDQDYNVFIHFWHHDNLLLQADYIPEEGTSSWEPGREYSYSGQIYIEKFIDEFDPEFKGEETLRLTVGFHSPYDRTGESKIEILERQLKVLPPPPDTPEIIYEAGWYDQEADPNSYLKKWRWSSKEARCIIDNPGRDALLVIRGGVNLEALQDQKVIFRINDLILDEFISAESYFEKSYQINKEMLGEGSEFILTIATDKSFTPAQILANSSDERELGMQISFIYFR